jgi:hypothetical protein
MFSIKKLLLLGFLFIIILVIPLTIYLVQQQQDSRSQATPSTVLAFLPSSKTASVGDKVSFDIMLSPGNNQVSFVKLAIKFDSTKLSTSAENFTVNTASNLTILEGPLVSGDTFLVALSIGNDSTKAIQADTKIATISFDVKGASDLPTQLTFDQNLTQVRSIKDGSQDAFNENVLKSTEPATITILGEGQTATPTPTGSISTQNLTPTPTGGISTSNITPTPTVASRVTATPTPRGTVGTTSTTNEEPICSSLTPDRSTTGNAPYSITFTANGTDTDGTITKATFNFGEGSVRDVTTGGGLGSSSVNVPLAHTYNSEGEFTVSVILTDNRNATSDSVNCSTTVTISGNAVATTSSSGSTASTTDSTSNLTPSPLPPTGPNDKVVGIGALGGILFLIGTLLFLAL